MMKLYELIAHLQAHSIKVENRAGKLHITAGEGQLSEAAVAALKQHKKEVAAYFAAPALEAVAAGDGPLSFAQRRLYFLYQYDPAATHFNLPVELGLRGALQVPRLQAALARVLARHPIYRTTYAVREGVPFQRYRPELEIPLDCDDLRPLTAQQRAQRMAAARSALAERPFDLEREAPIRLRLFRHADDEYALIIVFHHIATDEWSMQQLLRELAQAYRGELADTELPSYAQFVAWQQARHEQRGYVAARSYWTEHLSGAEPVISLPSDRARPPLQTYRTGLSRLALPEALRQRASHCAQGLGISEFALYLGLYQLLLHRLTGQRDLVVGTDVFGRDHGHFRDVAGFFVNQLALRQQVPAGISADAFLRRVAQDVDQALLFQDMPFDQVVDALQVERDPAYSPLFQVKFLYRRNSLALDLFDDVQCWDKHQFAVQSQYDLTLQVLPDAVEAYFNPDLFDAARVAGWLDLYLALADEVLSDPARPLAALLAQRLHAMLEPLCQGPQTPAASAALCDQIAAWAGQAPHRPAVLSDEGDLSFGELLRRMEAVAGQLVAVGVQRGDKVAVYLERSFDLVVAVLAVARIGAVLVPVDTDNPPEHTSFILQDSGANVVLSESQRADEIGDFYGLWLDVATLSEAMPAALPAYAACGADDLLYQLYTSGSTGRPKGVLVTRGGFANLCDWYARFAGIDHETPVLLMIPIGFDASLKNIFTPLMHGAPLVLAPAAPFDPRRLLGLIATRRVAVVNTAPSALYAFLEQDAANAYQSLRGLKMFAVGGEALNMALVRPWLESGECRTLLANIYGPTECTDISLAFRAGAAEWLARQTVTIGRPIQNMAAYIVDDELALCPPGSAGELLIAGCGVARGYHQLPEADAHSFVRSALSAGRVYRTGDYARLDADGNVIYLGRRDGQIKIRGKRVETSEVLAQMSRLLPGCALSVQRYARDRLEMLLGFVAGAPAGTDGAQLRAELARHLPRHAVPADIVMLPSLPLNANGKVSASALFELYEARRGQQAAQAQPLTATESAIAAIWRQLLGELALEAESSFFAVGGDSIFSIQLVAELQKLGYDVAVADVFKYPTLQQLAAFCEARPAVAADAGPAQLTPFALVAEADRPLLPAGVADAYPVTALQQGMLFHCKMEPESAMYHDVFSYELQFDFDADLLVEAIGRVVAHNPVLRTGFELDLTSEALQLVYAEVAPLIEQNDLRALAPAQQEASVAAAIADLKRRSFPLGGPSLIRFTILRKGESCIQLLIDAHHAILDGWSMATLQRQIFEHYGSLRFGRPLADVFDTGTLRFADYVARQLEDEHDPAAADFWRAYLGRLGGGALPAVLPQRTEAALYSMALPEALPARLAARMAADDVSLKTILLMAHAYMLRSLLPEARLSTALTDNGRPELPGAHNLVGLFVNVLPVAIDLDASWRTLGAQLQADEVERKPFRRYPFAHIVRGARAPQIDTLFTYNNFHVSEALQAADWLHIVPGNSYEETNFKLAVLVNGNVKSGLTLTLESRLALTAAQLETLQREFVFALECIAHSYDSPIPQRSGRALPLAAAGQATALQLRYQGADASQAVEAALARLALRRAATEAAAEGLPFAIHHAARDGWQEVHWQVAPAWAAAPALPALVSESLERLLAAAAQAGPVVAPELRCAPDGAWWPLPELEADLAFWQDQLGRSAGALNLPYSWARSAQPAGVVPCHARPVAVAEMLERIKPRSGLARPAILLGAWFALLARLSGQAAVLCGLRLAADGPVLPLTLDLGDDPQAEVVLARAAAALQEAAGHGAVPPGLPQLPLRFAAAFVPGADAGEVAADLTLVCGEQGHCQLLLAKDVFSAAAADRIAANLAVLLDAAAQAPQSPLSRLALLGDGERHQLLSVLNDSAQRFDDERQLHQMVEEQAAAQPDALALLYGEAGMSYGELNRRASQVAHFLAGQGVRPNDRVAICMERSLEMVVGILGILKAGAAYMPLDPAYPLERIQYMLDDSAPRALLAQPAMLTQLAAVGQLAARLPCLLLDEAMTALDGLPQHNPPAPPLSVAAGNLMYVLYTSGSTGRPKGVAMPQGPLVNLIRWQASSRSQLLQRERTLQFSALGFDATFQEIFSALCYGASLVLLSEPCRRDPRALVQLMRAQQVERIFLPFVALQNIAEAAVELGEPLPALNTMITAGEQLRISPAIVQFFRMRPGRSLHNYYGPTESHVVTTYVLDGEPGAWMALPPIGKPIANTQIYILDEALQLLPYGAHGELYIAGDCLADGYLNREELTAERFVANPFQPGRRMYKTGDIARWLEDGNIEYLGRNDSQVKIRGYRIEPGEVEAALAACAGVREVAVVAREDVPGQKRLVAYLLAQPGQILAPARLRDQLAAVLPEYMVPAAFVVMEAFPVSPNGKLDRRALPAPDASAQLRQPYEAPQGATETALARLWEDLLGVAGVGRRDHFFELGGHSLLAVRLTSRIRQLWRRELPLRTLFEQPLLAALAAALDGLAQAEAASLQPLPRLAGQGLPLSFAQQRLWFVQQLEGPNPTYNMPAALRLKGALDSDALQAALQYLVERHEVLRSAFVEVDGQPQVRIADAPPVSLPVIAVTAEQVPERARRHAAHCFDLAQAPLLRAELLRLSADEHVLLLNLHHIISDGWSLAILADEWLRAYDALRAGQPVALAPLALQYADYAGWQRASLTPALRERQLAYWTGKLAGAPELLELPTDRLRPAVQRYDGADEQLRLSPQLSAALRQLGQARNASLFMTLVSVFAVLLGRLSGQTDVMIGVPLATRDRRELEGMLGMLLGNLVLRVDLERNPDFAGLLAQVRSSTLEAYEHSAVPFEQVVEALPLRRDLSRNPLFQVFFNMLNLPESSYRSPELAVEGMEGALLDAKFDLTMYAQDSAQGILLHLSYNRCLFDASRMRELLGQYQHLLEQLCGQPESAHATATLLTAAARAVLPDPARLLNDDWHGSVPARFAAVAAQQPQALALASPDGDWSYQELDARSEAVACWLQAAGVAAGAVVAICAARRAELVAAVLGTLKAGAAYTIVDPAYPAEHVRACLAVADAAAWIQVATDAGAAALSACLPRPLPLLDLSQAGCWAALPQGARARPAVWQADDLAVLTFTSGSTGQPKAVEGRHGALTHFYPWLQQHFALQPQLRCAMLSGLAHDPLQRDIFNALWLGGSLHLPPAEAIGPALLAAWMAREQVQAVNLTPAMLQLLCQDAPPLPQLRIAFIVGDILTRADVALLQQVAPAVRVVSYYGATETQRAFGVVEIAPGSAAQFSREVVPLGRGSPDVQLLVLNAAGSQAGIGELGEVYIRSPHLARAYRADPDLTAQRFLPNPFGGGDRMYRTGDLGRYLPDGMVEGLGRRDQQVKLRGFRIELGHVEAALASLPLVQEAVVLAAGQGEQRQLVAYVVPRGAFDEPALRAALRERLPDFMRPAAYVALAHMPLTPNGKLDRNALPAVQAPPAPLQGAPRTALEERVCALMAEVLGRTEVGVHDSFFELGGHSLLATRLVSRLRAALGVQLPLRTVFEHPTVAGLLAKLADGTAGPVLPVPGARDGWHPLSSQQQRLWFLDQFEPGNPYYNIPLALRLQGELSLPALQASLQQLLARHPALRTRFASQAGRPMQEVLASLPLPLVQQDFAALAPAVREAAVEQAVRATAAQPFDLAQGQVLRASLLRLASDEHILVLVLHHIVSDGRSLAVLSEELLALYAAQAAGTSAALPPLALQYSDFAHWQQAWLEQPEAQRQLAYWTGQLADAPGVLALPFDRPRPALQSYRGATHEFTIDAATLAGLRALTRSQAEPTTLFMVLSAAFNVLLYRHSGQTDLCIGMPVANRPSEGLERVVGFFANTLVLRSRLLPEQPFQDFLRAVRQTTLDAFAHQDVAFERLVEAVKPARHTSHAPLFQVMLSLQETAPAPAAVAGLELSALPLDSGVARFDLTLSLVEDGELLRAAFEYNTDLFDHATLVRWAGHWQQLLAAIVAAPATALDRLPLLDAAERASVLAASLGERHGAVGDIALHRLFEQRALAAPEQVAALDGASSISYADLNAQADRLARRLRQAGVAAGSLVGVYAGRSLELLAALLGVLKAGAAYVPLDPAQPAERLGHMLSDSAPAALLVQPGLQDDALLQGASCPVLPLDQALDQAGPPLDTQVDPQALAYVLYTSGSTGLPKGVMVSHANIVNTVRAHVRQCGLQPHDRVLQFVSSGFDVSAGEIFGCLAAGATLVIKPEQLRVPDAAFADFLRQQQVSVADLPAAFWHQWVQEIAAGRSLPGPALRLVLAGGEKTELAHLRTWLSLPATRHCRWINAYGPTETTVNASYMPYDALSDLPEGEIPIGRPIDNTSAYVLDAHLQPVACGIAGEIYLGGAGVARGYLHQPELSASKFLADPFSAQPGARLYRSGDIGRRLADGTLEYLGRSDSQVKLRGYRIELGEIQSRLAALAGLREAAVLLRQDDGAAPRLVAYVVAAGARPALSQLRAQLAASLPDYMVPASFVWLDALPINANGKVDSARLPAPTADDLAQAAYEAPSGAREQALAAVWQDLLALPRVGRQDHFFELGGHSLLVVNLIDRLQQQGLLVDVRTVFSNPTLAAMAAALAERGAAPAAFVAPPNLIPGAAGAADPSNPTNFEEFEL